MPRYIVEVEVTQVQVYEGTWDDEDDAEENFDDGDQTRMDIEDRSVTSVELDDSVLCTCGHPSAEHQTGTGAYTGFCSDSECKCDSPTDDEEENS